MKKIKVMVVIGTRPEAIKMLPIIKELEIDDRFTCVTTVTAQHRKMLDQVLEQFSIETDYDLNVMRDQQSLNALTIKIMERIEHILASEQPDILFVHGDTTTTLAASLAAFYHKIPIAHIEAGLRTWDKYNPFPEEMNRQITDVLSDLYFSPTETSKLNLEEEGKNSENIYVTGNTAIDALKYTVQPNYHHPILNVVNPKNKLILLTMHRRENQGLPMERVFKAVKKAVQKYNDIEVVFPVHLNPKVQNVARDLLSDQERIHLIEPLDVIDFHNIAAKSYIILTDSGGVQEEAPSLNVPVLVLRDDTERPEGIETGALKLVGTQEKNVLDALTILLSDKEEYNRMVTARNPYGDGEAAKRILNYTYDYFIHS